MEPVVEQVTTNYLDLGEGPHWDAKTQVLYYIDVFGKSVIKFNPKTKREIIGKLENAVSFFIPIEGKNDHFVAGVGLKIVILKWDGKSETLQQVESLGEGKLGRKFNDGKVDPYGRLFAGTNPPFITLDDIEPNTCALYMVDNSGTREICKNVTFSNGLAWDVERNIFYHVDTIPKIVYSYDYNPTNGEICNKKTALSFAELGIDGHPDGITIDTDGNLWVACIGASQIIKFDPIKGKLLQTVKLPAKYVTSVTFGGQNLDELYVTTGGSKSLDKTLNPPSGALFVIKNLGVKGYPSKSYRLE